MPDVTINPEVAFSIALKAREYVAKVDQTDPDRVSNATHDGSVDALKFGLPDQTLHELVSAVSDLNDDEQRDFIALIYYGRGDLTCRTGSRPAGCNGNWSAGNAAICGEGTLGPRLCRRGTFAFW